MVESIVIIFKLISDSMIIFAFDPEVRMKK